MSFADFMVFAETGKTSSWFIHNRLLDSKFKAALSFFLIYIREFNAL
jgi:hypothetical protein